jgi:predicted nucleic acid-binding protein
MESSGERYLDTSALIAALDRADSYFSTYERLFKQRPPLAASSLVIVEAYGWFLRRHGQYKALQVLQFAAELRPFTIVPFGVEELGRIAVLLYKFADQKLSMADAHGLLIMRERRVKACWSTDRHLGLTGVRLVN